MKRKQYFFILICVLLSFLVIGEDDNQVEAFSDQIIQQGAVGEDVIELQARLQYLGFYNGKIDGVFGWGTYWALRNFQYEFGLEKIDGLGGQKTKEMLERASEYNKSYVHEQLKQGNKFTHYGGMPLEHQTKKQDPKKEAGQGEQGKGGSSQPEQKREETQEAPPENQPTEEQQNQEGNQQPTRDQEEATPAPQEEAPPAPQEEETGENANEDVDLEPTAVNVPQGFSQNDINLMANAVHGEARGEPYEGKVAVAAVILNRLESPTFPNTISGVIFEPAAFTAVADGQIWLTPDDSARRAVIDAINGWDPTGEAVYYFNPDTATNSWIWSRPQIKRIGKHIFCM
ncbi:N-acetylmuramoyl-L-alanine amidase [Gracilibacillus halotolerans]|uniref:Spore cortex-lytic enzyme n=1 Tax=Gracilibacillus halotolerans TaxID=74386 RepID=A0A841RGC4_9BACI|nr:spore cortex-lytic enzyme [Gracilibacillus halotolerans]MBB6511671.1 N-acetylmuramoyl-L-alanine amidase [Gracilibacillus halotolerans]